MVDASVLGCCCCCCSMTHTHADTQTHADTRTQVDEWTGNVAACLRSPHTDRWHSGPVGPLVKGSATMETIIFARPPGVGAILLRLIIQHHSPPTIPPSLFL
uniref:Putative secreted protein n=1 Tax=Anopheles darlingi TaxID=43151 RepID=A0A2M4DLT0_ANODA